ncbi:hypothetical protein [Variovorax sp.]|jgi:hypothetical protein|uniref:hypothetical protein n=1 Tax=Variovorax sp. TaxID=1871043 RepID=UPI000ADAB925
MRSKMLSERQQRVLVSMKLLATFWQRRLPAESTSRDEIEQLLSLEAAGLVRATFDRPLRERTGEFYIPRAIVLEVTAEGLSALTRAQRQQPGILGEMPSRRPARSSRGRKAGAGAEPIPGHSVVK